MTSRKATSSKPGSYRRSPALDVPRALSRVGVPAWHMTARTVVLNGRVRAVAVAHGMWRIQVEPSCGITTTHFVRSEHG